MKKILLICLLANFSNVSGQTITIGTGTANTLYGPIYIYSSSSPNTHSWNLTIYDQTEILAAGGQLADISGISWNKTDTGSYLTPDATFRIYMKHTTLNEFAAAADFDVEVIGATLVYENVYQSLQSTTGWINFPFTNNFSWNGVDNIMILTQWTRIGNATNAVNWQATSTTPLTRVSHSFNSSSTMGSLYTSGNRPNIQLNLNASTFTGNGIANHSINIYPNPVNDFIVFDKVNFPSLFSITDLTGKIVFTKSIEAGESQLISLPVLEKGIYGIRIVNDNYSYGGKIIVAQ